MNNKERDFKLRWLILPALFLAVITSFTQCAEEYGDPTDKKATIPYDPSKPVEFTTFYPDSGGARTQMIIKGRNFGTDLSQIKVFVNGKKAPVIGSSGSEILALVPARADTGAVTIQIGNGNTLKEVASTNEFKYIFRPTVSTLVGFVDRDGKTAVVDGDFETAQLEEPYWLCFDKNKNLYVIEEDRGMRFIDMKNEQVTTKFRTGNGIDRPRTIAFSLSYDTMYVAHDAGDWTNIAGLRLTSQDDFTAWTGFLFSKQCNGISVHPQTGSLFFNSYEQGQVYRYNPAFQGGREELFRIDDKEWEFNIQFAPSGDFAYIVVKNENYILKSNFNRQTGLLEAATIFAGYKGRGGGYVDGVGTTARFRSPQQGAFDEDNNFYLCDGGNHCIRKITPEGIVSTFAGRPENYGYSDGSLRDAQFDRPYGIVYDQESATFYIADQKNHRIRVIKTE
jgi:DNA-binding beta-propeller fold protein YncE